MFSTDPTLALFALLPLPLINVTARRFSSRIHPQVRAVQQEQAELATVVEETVGGIRVVKGFGAEQVQFDKLEHEADDIQRESLGAAKVRATYLPFMELLPIAGLVLVLAIGGSRVLDGRLTVGELVAFTFYVQLLVWPLRTIGMTVPEVTGPATVAGTCAISWLLSVGGKIGKISGQPLAGEPLIVR